MIRRMMQPLVIFCICFLTSTTTALSSSTAINIVDISTGNLKLHAIPSTSKKGIVTIITSPGTPSSLVPSEVDKADDETILQFVSNDDSSIQLICRGATLQGTNEIERFSLAFCSVVSNSIIIIGITSGDYQGGSLLRHSRHSRTLTALFRSRLIHSSLITSDEHNNNPKKQTLILLVDNSEVNDNDDSYDSMKQEVLSLYQAAAVERKGSPDFDIIYDLQIVKDPVKALSVASQAAVVVDSDIQTSPLNTLFNNAWSMVHEADTSASISAGLDPPHIAQAFLSVMNSHAKYTKIVRSRIASWKNRVARGLWIDGFGAEATALKQRCLYKGYDVETLVAAGLPQVAQYRLELRSQIQSLIDTSIEDLFNKQVINLQTSSVKRLQASLLKNIVSDKNTYETNESIMNSNAAMLRQQSFNADTVLDDIQVPMLNLTKEKASRTITAALSDALIQFPDSPMAKLKRSKQLQNVVTKERKSKKPSQRSLVFGIDLVAMIRPDGFGSLQGFAGYALPGGNSITVGVHNDADDPQVIAQFGGVRPPLIRIQPKLRVDVEL